MLKRFLSIWMLCGCLLGATAQERVKFVVFADLHYDLMPDGGRRLADILGAAAKQQADFVVDLGDFVPASARYDSVRRQVANAAVPVYHTLGNHDLDLTDKQTYAAYWGMPAPYYYFDRGKFRFIVLDSNFFVDKDGQTKPYDRHNYGRVGEEARNRYGEEQLGWLEKLLADTTRICVLFSHAPVNDGYAEVVQNRAVHQLLTNARNRGTRVAMVFGGHIHSDNYHCIDGIHYLQVNGASYIWGGSKFTTTARYPDAVHRAYPSLKYVIPYDRALFATVELDDKGKIRIKGTKGRYVKPEPDKALLKTKSYPCSPIISSLKLRY